jgi:trimethylamine---corrinoid protein Co-methyltransferase
MRVNYQMNGSVQFQVLSDDQRQEIFRAALHALEHTGVEVYNPEALDILKAQGAWVDGIRARIPSYLVWRALASAPSSFTIYSREGNPDKNITISPNCINYGPGPTCPNFRDPHTSERRRYLRQDALAVARVCDSLPNIDFVQSLGTVSDVNPDLADVYEFADMIGNTGKPIVAWSYTLDTCRDIHLIATAVAGSSAVLRERPNYIFYAEPLSPLVSSHEAADKLLYCAKNRIPIIYTPCPIGGGTAPTTSAGILVTAICESLHGLVIAQGISPGTPFVMGGVVSIMDMLNAVLAYGAPELSLQSAALTEMARYMGLPMWSTAGCTDSKLVDEQAGIEGAISLLFAGLSGANLIHDVGYTESGLTGDLRMTTMCNEIISYIKRILRGIEVTPETLAIDVIRQVGPNGNYLASEHTLSHFKDQFWFPSLMDRSGWAEWESSGSLAMGDRVQRQINAMLDTHKPVPLKQETQKQIDEILAKAEARYQT